MRKLLISLVCGASLALSGCSTVSGWSDAVSDSLGGLPLMYRPDVQQGNVIEQREINRLVIGMSKNQVRFTMGTPMLIDVFHQDRWDYFYTMKRNRQPFEQEQVILLFEDDRLIAIEGDRRQIVDGDIGTDQQAKVVSVPDFGTYNEGILSGILESVGLESELDD